MREEILNDAVESLFGLFGEHAPENAATDIAYGFGGDDADAEEIWERYNARLDSLGLTW